MRIRLEVGEPDVDPGAWIAENAVLAGAVTIEAQASVWFGAVVRADGDTVRLGARSNLQDGAVVHADPGLPVTIGADVSVGHGAVLHGCTVGDGALVGMRAAVLNGARIGAQSLVAAGAVVLEGAEFEPRSLIAGVPAKRRRELTGEEVAGLAGNAAIYLALAAAYRTATTPPER
ncbi:gamma carbonic anhydrase family protein [Nocardioides anomalus]|uniref:Gamma carbonic anhydrase family protein n=1 Tax=Nocardioides anomalus TaxID=2712223 RepID=A0A6G6WIU2_9ACTN|nr:gamma carbonic anhydrase family protein [Nocardioides anomalus]QIG45164.1 gamma carbonic anhydrase family protein [Nocardioides anomalus]